MMRRFRLCGARPIALALALSAAPCALAGNTDYPVTGTITVNGSAGALPAGGEFTGTSYDAASGAIAAGVFVFPVATINFQSPLGPVTATYRLSQTNTSNGQVAADGLAALGSAAMKLQILSAALGGVIPIDVGTCIFEPIDVVLDGTGSASGLALGDSSFTVPTVASSDCGGNGDQINGGIAGSDNSMQIVIAGDFTPPDNLDLIFADGFDPAG